MKTRYAHLIATVALAALSLSAPRPATAQSDQDNTAHTAWNWLKNVSATTLTNYLSKNNCRITDLQVVTGGTDPRFDAVVVKNTGAYAKGWLWYSGLTLEQIIPMANSYHARPTVVAPYLVNGSPRFAVCMIGNSGRDAVGGWLILAESDSAKLISTIEQSNARLIQLKPYGGSGKTLGYVGIGVSKDSRQSLALAQATLGQINSLINAGYRPVEVVPDFSGKYCALLDNFNANWIALFGIASDDVWGNATINNARPLSIARDGTAFDVIDTAN